MAEKDEITEIISDIDLEISTANDKLIEEGLKKAMKNIKISPDNIDSNLMNMIMASKGTRTQQKPGKPKSAPPVSEETGCEPPPIVDAQTSEIIADIYVGNNVYLYGPAGTGKTYMAEMISEKLLNRKHFTINCSQWTSPINIIGGQTITGYEQGVVIKAWQEGGILILDELPKLDPNTAGLLNQALAKTADQITECEGENIVPTITDGKGDKILKGGGDPDKAVLFGVIATGNTTMKQPSMEYGGNNRQDYSLIDRFSGSYYKISFNESLERELIYPGVFDICLLLRNFLLSKADPLESISLRTMLNFNRIYEQEMLNLLGSKLANWRLENQGKTLNESVWSFVDTMPDEMRKELRENDDFNNMLDNISSEESMTEFRRHYLQIHNCVDPIESTPEKYVFDKECQKQMKEREKALEKTRKELAENK